MLPTPPLSLPVSTPTRLDRALALFADVRAGEGAGALLLATNVFCLLTFYSVLKIVREALILSEGRAEVKSYAAAGQALYGESYTALARRFRRDRRYMPRWMWDPQYVVAQGIAVHRPTAPATSST